MHRGVLLGAKLGSLQAHPPVRPWMSGILMVLCCGDTLRCILRFRELTGHWPDLRKRDLGAKDKEKEEKEL